MLYVWQHARGARYGLYPKQRKCAKHIYTVDDESLLCVYLGEKILISNTATTHAVYGGVVF
jgi:hypothetical protein